MRPFCLLIVPLLALTACGSRHLDNGQARKAITQLPQEILEKEDVDILAVIQTSGSSAVVESRVRTAFRLAKVDGAWAVRDIRIGHGEWETVANLAEALDRVKAEQTRADLERIAAAVLEYGNRAGGMPEFRDFIDLTDLLAPKYLDPLIRLDAWRNPLRATTSPAGPILVTSAGPDGLFATEDDLDITIAP